MRPSTKQSTYMSIIGLSISLIFLCGFSFFSTPEEENGKIQSLLNKTFKALNEQNWDELNQTIDEKTFSVVMADGHLLNKIDDLKQHQEKRFFGKTDVYQKLTIEPNLNQKPELLNQVAIIQGTSNNAYQFIHNQVLTTQSRWMAIVTKAENDWKLSKLQFTTDFTDNPVLEKTKAKKGYYLLFGLVLGFIAGCLFMVVLPKIDPKNRKITPPNID